MASLPRQSNSACMEPSTLTALHEEATKTAAPVSSPLCRFCTRSGIWEHLSGQRLVLKWILGFINDPADVQDQARQDCPFCRMVFDILPETAFANEHRHMYTGKGAESVYCSLRPEGYTVRGKMLTSFAVFYNFLEYVSHSRKIWQIHCGSIGLDSKARPQLNGCGPGISPIGTPDTLDPGLIQTWIDRCQHSHPDCQWVYENRSHIQDTLMIDVRDRCLIEGSTLCRYAALSYVWGQVEMMQTTKANLGSLLTPGALGQDIVWKQLSKVVRDCILLCERISIPFMWVDCLCIVQDDYESKDRQIAHMDVIYSQSDLTLIPLTGVNADSNVPGVPPGTRAMLAVPVQTTSRGSEGRENLVLICGPKWEDFFYGSFYESRGWTLQEKVLSVRCLYLTRWGMWFQCLEGRYSDAETGELPLDPSYNNFTSLLYLPTSEDRSDMAHLQIAWLRTLLTFAQHVEWYSARKLTYRSDHLNAFKGILNFFRHRRQQEFLCGHPLGMFFAVSLLWIHVDAGRSRDAVGPIGEEAVLEDYFPDRDTNFPTWSWMGWMSTVSYRIIDELSAEQIPFNFDDSVDLGIRYAPDEDMHAEQINGKVSTNSSERTLDHWALKIRAPSISTIDMCCGRTSGFHIPTIDETHGTFALLSDLFPVDYQNSPVLPIAEKAPDPPCGMLFGIPFWGLNHDENHRFILLKIIPGEGSSESTCSLFKSCNSLKELFESQTRGPFCIALLVSMGRYVERRGLAMIDLAFWGSRTPVVEEYVLL